MKRSLCYISLLGLIPFSNIYAQTIEVPNSGEGGAQTTTLIDTGIGIHQGNVWVWGYKGSGQHGRGDDYNANNDRDRVPTLVLFPYSQQVIAVSGGAYHIIAITAEGLAWGWGLNAYGSAGCENPKGTNKIETPCLIRDTYGQPLILKQAVGAGEYNSIYLDIYGKVYTSGNPALAQLGLGKNPGNTYVPKQVNLGGETARIVGAAYEGGFAVTHEGNVWAWGRDFYSSLGLYMNGDNYVWSPQRVDRLKPYADKIIRIAGGYRYGLALLDDGSLIGWGMYKALGQSCGTSSSSKVSPEPVIVPIPGKVKQFETRFESTVVLNDENDIFTFGALNSGSYENIQGWCPKKAPLSASFRSQHGRVLKIGAGKHHVTYQMEDGTTWGVGYNAGGQIKYGAGTPIRNWPGIEMRPIPYP